MKEQRQYLGSSALVMRLVGWTCLVLGGALLIYPPGFIWGVLPEGVPHLGPAHAASPYDGLHPYLFMLLALYVGFGFCLVRGAGDPKRNVALFDFGIVGNLLHALVMIPQSFLYPNEHAHMWADIPAAFLIVWMLWRWHPDRAGAA
jgi:hypothetical protein